MSSTILREFKFTREDFDFLRDVANNYTGIVLNEDKFDMLYTRISRRIRVLGLENFAQYCDYLKNNEETESTELINSVTTNLTSFFREPHHFEYLENVLINTLVERNRSSRRIRVWSAGCSTGEEAYSIAMTLKKANIPSGWDVKVLATDIDGNVLEKSTQGVYGVDSINGLSDEHIRRWFLKGEGDRKGSIRVGKELRDMVFFKKLNLISEWPISGPVDAIFCRNVMIYFDRETKVRLAQRFSQIMHEKSNIFIGHSESFFRISDMFESLGKTIYMKKKNVM